MFPLTTPPFRSTRNDSHRLSAECQMDSDLAVVSIVHSLRENRAALLWCTLRSLAQACCLPILVETPATPIEITSRSIAEANVQEASTS